MIDSATAAHSQCSIAVAKFIDGHDHSAAAGQLNGIGITGIFIVLIAVKQQNSRSRIIRSGSMGAVEFVSNGSFLQRK